MYIASVHIVNFRCFRNTSVDFIQGVNVIIGENNSGKTALLRALGLVFSSQTRSRMQRYDFNQAISDLTEPPTITVAVTLRSEGKQTDQIADRALVAAWLIKLESPWEAQLTYRFALPEEDIPAFKSRLGENPSADRFWETVDYFLPKYVSRVYGGKPDAQIRAEPEHLAKFSYQFVDAIRDAESQLFSGTNPLLRTMLAQVLDHDIEQDENRDRAAKDRAIKDRQTGFRIKSKELTQTLEKRIALDALTTLITETGAEDGGTPRVSGEVDETDLISALKLFIERSGLTLPAAFNGLGYNNLVYISFLLASLDLESDYERQGQNAIVFPMLVVEEPEAHLHPALQYKLLRFIRDRGKARSRQVFLTTHSTHITAASALDSIICMSAPADKADPRLSYPGKVFADTEEGWTSKKYVERFLDATKSTMLFAKGIILVEGLAEQLLIPCLAEYLGLSLETKHVALVPVGGSTFKHFLPLFGAGCGDDQTEYALNRRVACIVDADPMRKEKEQERAYWKKCWPCELDRDADSYEYRAQSGVVKHLLELCKDREDTVLVKYGTKTLEYDLAYENADNDIIVCKGSLTADLPVECVGDSGASNELKSRIDPEIQRSLEAIVSSDDQRKAEFATRVLLAAEGAKGEYAFDLEHQLRDNLEKVPRDQKALVVPTYIKEAIRWACGLDAKEGTV